MLVAETVHDRETEPVALDEHVFVREGEGVDVMV